MKTRTSLAPPRTLDLDTLDRVIGGCQMVVVPHDAQQHPVALSHMPRDPGLAIASGDAWSSLGSMGSSASFTHEAVATAFIRSGVVHGAPHGDPPHAADTADRANASATSTHGGRMASEDEPHAPIALHCGTTTNTVA